MILDAALDTLRERGTGVALAVIAERAGVSKGGLLHHFPSREDLFLAVADDALARLRARVLELVDLSENHPGKTLRAYVRALFERGPEVRDNFDHVGLWSSLSSIPRVADLLARDSEYWREQLAGDGLHPDRVLVVRHTAESLAFSQYVDPETEAVLVRARALLLAMTAEEGPLLEESTEP